MRENMNVAHVIFKEKLCFPVTNELLIHLDLTSLIQKDQEALTQTQYV